jgi:TetR/AcrR family transcriptional regulator, transcriptional repressor for nem operon
MVRIRDAKERLLSSALKLFSERSYANVSVQELCEHAGVKKGSFYYFLQVQTGSDVGSAGASIPGD